MCRYAQFTLSSRQLNYRGFPLIFLNKVAASLEYRKSNSERKEAISLCIVDFKTLDIYSLQDYWRSYFVRDYYVEMDFDDNIVRTEVFYLPERQ